MPQLKYSFFLILFYSFALQGQESIDFYLKKTRSSNLKNTYLNYQLTAYNKLIVTADPKASKGFIDTLFKYKKGKKHIKEIDSSDFKFKRIISKQHLYQAEKISVITKNDTHIKEEIVSTKMAGFQEPIYEYFSLQLQPFDVYSDKLEIAEKEYLNPISSKGLKKYYYYLGKDTILNQRAVVELLFKTKKPTRHNHLNGRIYIDKEKYSIAAAVYHTLGKINCKSQHEFYFDEQLNNWFPKQTKLTIKKGDSKYPIKILGEYITFDETADKYNPSGKKYASDFLEVQSTTKYSQTTFGNFPIKQKKFNIQIPEKAITRKGEDWFAFFNDSIDVRSKATYVSVDSLIEARKYENKLKIGRKIIKGYVPIGLIDLDLRYLIKYNNYEGFRLGLGGITNPKFSKIWRTEGYLVYGTKDNDFKRGVSSALLLDKTTETWLGLGYKDDVSEIANTALEIDKRTFKIYDPRPFNLTTFYNHTSYRAYVESKFTPKTEAIFQLTHSRIHPLFEYHYELNGTSITDFNLTALTFSLQWNPFSHYMQTPNGRIEYDRKFPKFTFQYYKTLPNLWNNTYDFSKFDLRVEYQKKFNSNHKIGFQLETGYATGDIPVTHLYNHAPNNLNKDKILQRITFAGRDSFETMYFNEFFADKYLYLHYRHQFPKWQINRQIKPVFNWVTRYGIGALDKKENHKEMAFKTLEKGYWESGIEMNQIYKGVGLVAFYRFGPNQLPSFEDNIAIKLSVQINLGLNN